MFINLNLLKMKKLKLKMKELTNPSVLTHHQLKNVMGGSGIVWGGSFTVCEANCGTHTVEITNCTASCTAQDNFGVSCTDSAPFPPRTVSCF